MWIRTEPWSWMSSLISSCTDAGRPKTNRKTCSKSQGQNRKEHDIACGFKFRGIVKNWVPYGSHKNISIVSMIGKSIMYWRGWYFCKLLQFDSTSGPTWSPLFSGCHVMCIQKIYMFTYTMLAYLHLLVSTFVHSWHETPDSSTFWMSLNVCPSKESRRWPKSCRITADHSANKLGQTCRSLPEYHPWCAHSTVYVWRNLYRIISLRGIEHHLVVFCDRSRPNKSQQPLGSGKSGRKTSWRSVAGIGWHGSKIWENNMENIDEHIDLDWF